MRNYTVQRVLQSIAIVVLSVAAFFLFRAGYINEQKKRAEVEAEWVAEQIAADRAYEAEVRRETARWEEIEAITPLSATVETVEEPAEEEEFNDTRIPDDIEAAAIYWGEVYELEPEFLEAVAWAESRFDPEAVNGGCVGLMQVSPIWHTERAEKLGFTAEDLMTVEGSMAVAADYLAELKAKHDDYYWVLMTYNGDSRASSYLELEAGPSEYALIIVDVTYELISTHRLGDSATWLSY